MKTINIFIISTILFFIIIACKSDKDKPVKDNLGTKEIKIEKTTETQTEKETETASNVIISEDKKSLQKYYDIPHIKEFYNWQKMSYSPSYEFPG